MLMMIIKLRYSSALISNY